MRLLSFYDVSIAGTRSIESAGKTIDADHLVASTYGRDPDLFQRLGLLNKIVTFDPSGVEKSQRWEKTISTMIYCLSGQIPDRQEVLRGRQIIHNLPKWFKRKHLDERFVLSFLPYLLIGFKTHVESDFRADSNRIDEACKFIIHLYENTSVELTSYLCAHRGSSQNGGQALIDKIRMERACRTLNLQKGILTNTPSLTKRKIRWYQQGPTEMASSNMFPEMFAHYLASGKIPDLLVLLAQHFDDVSSLSGEVTNSPVEFEVVNLDSFTKAVISFLDSTFGRGWAATDYETNGAGRDRLVQVALDCVMPEIKRLTPFYGSARAKEFSKTRQGFTEINLARAQEIGIEKGFGATDLIRTTEGAIDWFYQNQLMHPSAKALYETAFYYVWGLSVSARPGGTAIGIDRDHSDYQNIAWSMGYADGQRKNPERFSTGILYARRTPNEIPGSALRDISYRQFWR